MVELAVQVELVAVAPSMALPVSPDLLEQLQFWGMGLTFLALTEQVARQEQVAWQEQVALVDRVEMAVTQHAVTHQALTFVPLVPLGVPAVRVAQVAPAVLEATVATAVQSRPLELGPQL